MAGVRIKCFGVGDGWPSADRNHSSYLYQLGGVTLIVDCGEPLSRSFKATQMPFETIDAVLLSHTHGDHVGGFVMFMQGLWLEQRTRDLPFYMPADAIDPLTKMLNACYIFPELLAFKAEYKAWEARKPVNIGAVRVTPYRTTHLDSLRDSFQKLHPQSFDCFAFRIQSEKYHIVHSADLGAVTDLEPLLQEPVDLLVCELAHFTPEEIFACLKEKPIKKVAFTHVGRPYWENLPDLEIQAKKMLPEIEVVFPKDGDELTITESRLR